MSRAAIEPIRVMHVVFTLHPGGMEFGVIKLVNGLDRARVRSSICSTTPAVPEMKACVAADVPVFELRRRPGNDPGLVRDLYRLFRRERPHVVHTHAWGTLLEGLVAARLARVPFVVHGEHGTLQLRGYQRRLQRAAWSRADRVLSVSSRLAERMTAETGFPFDRIMTLRNGVDLSRFGRQRRDEARQALGLPLGGFIIGTAGRLVPVKDQATLLEAVARVRAAGHEVTLVLAGDGPLKDDLESRAASLGISLAVRFLGHCDRIETVFSALDVFILSSVSEGMSNTILEAMASGLPVVATRVGGADELIEDGVSGVLVRSRSAEAIAAAIMDMLADTPRRLEIGAAARRRAEAEFSLPSFTSRYERMYMALAEERAGRDARRRAEVHA
jgi:sugar transferase (PEP-CTERM/EpsH1 system associated)